MTKEFYLGLVQKLDMMIENKIEELGVLRALGEKTTQENNGMPHAIGISDKVGNNTVKIVMKQQEIDETINLFVDLKDEIIKQLQKLHKDEYDVLYKAYVQGMHIFDIADSRNQSDTWIKILKKRGIKNLVILESDTFERVKNLVT